ncbi:unknown function [Klebsiella phage vB_Kpn_K10PH82C1]|uniref:Uncharacterized protein n=1 Tax=Klebsiella phage vB_Kpn_K10PH82C1 TaxID=3071631 RepID=A0AAD2Q086_9CAUD|nr:unknown function [Klebsiella phage vB_Kpn_K10PH82C1]
MRPTETLKLSSIVNHNEIFVNDKGYAWIQLKEFDKTGKRYRTVVRKVTSKYFSNWSMESVRIDGVHYLIDSQITVSPTASASAPYFAN